MGRPRNPFPSYLKHSQTGRAIVVVRNYDGSRRTISLPGPFGSIESKEAYQQIIATLSANAGRLPAGRVLVADLRVAELADRFDREKVQIDYRKGTGEQWCFRQAIKVLCRVHGATLVRDFDAAALDSVRRSMISGAWMTVEERTRSEKLGRVAGWSRKTINKQISRLRSLFRWGVPAKLVPVHVVTDLECLAPLRKGKGGARESKKVPPVPAAVVEATLPHLPPVVRDMVEVQRLSGVRPGELCGLTVRELDMTGDVWIYRPGEHKNEHRDQDRTIAFGPKAQAILRRHLKLELDAFLFSPREQARVLKAQKRAARKTPVQPSQVDRSTSAPRKRPGLRFTTTSYTRAIVRACRRAGIEPWHAHQLRHLASLMFRRNHGIEAARATLGHQHVDMAAHYGGIDVELAVQVARAMG